MRLHRGLAALTLGTVAVLGLTACSADSDRDATTSGSSAAADPTPVVEEEAGLTAENFAQRTTAALVAAETMSMTMDMSAEGESISMDGVVRMTKSTMDMQVTYSMLGMNFDMIFIGGQVFMGTGGQFQEMTAADMGVESLDELVEQADARAQIENLAGAITSVEAQGEEAIDGIATTRYAVTVDPSKLAGADPTAVAAMGDSFVYDYWLDAENRPVLMSYTVQGVEASIGYADFGQPVTIAAPDPSQLTTELF